MKIHTDEGVYQLAVAVGQTDGWCITFQRHGEEQQKTKRSFGRVLTVGCIGQPFEINGIHKGLVRAIEGVPTA